jgi:hypothetical protein
MGVEMLVVHRVLLPTAMPSGKCIVGLSGDATPLCAHSDSWSGPRLRGQARAAGRKARRARAPW